MDIFYKNSKALYSQNTPVYKIHPHLQELKIISDIRKTISKEM